MHKSTNGELPALFDVNFVKFSGIQLHNSIQICNSVHFLPQIATSLSHNQLENHGTKLSTKIHSYIKKNKQYAIFN